MTNCQLNVQFRHIHHDHANQKSEPLHHEQLQLLLTCKIQQTTLICIQPDIQCIMNHQPKLVENSQIYGVIRWNRQWKRQLIALIFSPVLQRFVVTWDGLKIGETDEDQLVSSVSRCVNPQFFIVFLLS